MLGYSNNAEVRLQQYMQRVQDDVLYVNCALAIFEGL